MRSNHDLTWLFTMQIFSFEGVIESKVVVAWGFEGVIKAVSKG
jgi:hypothetical protein